MPRMPGRVPPPAPEDAVKRSLSIAALIAVTLAARPARAGVEGHSPSAPDPTASATQPPDREMLFDTTPDPVEDTLDVGKLTSGSRWKALHDMLASGDVLLVFAPTDAQLLALESEADSLRAHGVFPVGVRQCTDAANRATIKHLGLSVRLMADPHAELAGDFRLATSSGSGTKPAWFVVDRKGRVRALSHQPLPVKGLTRIVTGTLEPRDQASDVKP